MADITTFWDAQNGRGDWKVVDGVLESGDDLVTAVYISFFTDRRAQPSDVIPDGTNNPRGWWADTDTKGNLDEWGSRFWLLDRRKSPTTKTLNDAVTYGNECLAWMITDGVAAQINITAAWNASNFLAVKAEIYKTGSTKPVIIKFQLLWNEVQS